MSCISGRSAVHIVALCSLLAACNANQTEISVPFAGEIQAIRAQAQGTPHESFTLKVVEDGQISDTEMLEAVEHFVSCMHDHGLDTFRMDPLSGNFGELRNPERWSQGEYSAALQSCSRETNGDILGSLWSSMQTNPHNVDEDEYFVSCLKKLQVIDPTYTGAQYKEDFDTFSSQNADTNGHSSEDPNLAVIPFVVNEDKAIAAMVRCISEPQTVLSIEQQLD